MNYNCLVKILNYINEDGENMLTLDNIICHRKLPDG